MLPSDKSTPAGVARLRLLAALWVWAAVTGGCSRDGGAAPPGATTTGADGGAPPIANLDGAAALPPQSDCMLPSCLAVLLAPCTPAGDCTRQNSAEGRWNVCYANGVKMFSTIQGPFPGGSIVATIRVTRPDGETCYERIASSDMLANLTFSYQNARGAPVATAVRRSNGQTTVSCEGQPPQPVNAACLTLPAADVNGQACAPGSCR
jgi:hypothetical protein